AFQFMVEFLFMTFTYGGRARRISRRGQGTARARDRRPGLRSRRLQGRAFQRKDGGCSQQFYAEIDGCQIDIAWRAGQFPEHNGLDFGRGPDYVPARFWRREGVPPARRRRRKHRPRRGWGAARTFFLTGKGKSYGQ